MNGYILSEAADADLQLILVGSVAQWGLARAERYILELHEAFETLAAFPNLGRDAREPHCFLPENRCRRVCRPRAAPEAVA
jgi:toxin ParE1/3/4